MVVVHAAGSFNPFLLQQKNSTIRSFVGSFISFKITWHKPSVLGITDFLWNLERLHVTSLNEITRGNVRLITVSCGFLSSEPWHVWNCNAYPHSLPLDSHISEELLSYSSLAQTLCFVASKQSLQNSCLHYTLPSNWFLGCVTSFRFVHTYDDLNNIAYPFLAGLTKLATLFSGTDTSSTHAQTMPCLKFCNQYNGAVWLQGPLKHRGTVQNHHKHFQFEVTRQRVLTFSSLFSLLDMALYSKA